MSILSHRATAMKNKNKNKCKINYFTNENELLRVQQAATHCIVITAFFFIVWRVLPCF